MPYNMLPSEIKITDADIGHAAKILLPEGVGFDTDTTNFIKNLETIDLHAVPGSGKTTALLAKLLILDRYLPFDDGSGILVLSHTNAAVDEIKKRLVANCPNLFSYPNFVETIQGFVDKFLVLPYFAAKYRRKPYRIDNDTYEKCIDKHKYCITGFTDQERRNVLHYLTANDNLKTYRLLLRNGEIVVVDGLEGQPLSFCRPKGNTKAKNYKDFTQNEKDRIRKYLIDLKKQVFEKDAVLCYDDAYFLAEVYLHRCPQVKSFLNKRFRYVFVDEMQDMEKHQHDLLEKLFYGDGAIETIYQRIGDPNQAIYGKVKAETVWESRKKVLPLKGSHRLSKPIAAIVQNFGLNYIEIEGKNTGLIKPIIITYTDTTIQTVIPTFANIIKQNLLPAELKYPYKAIAWVAKEKNDAAKIALPDYFPQYNKLTKISKREVFDSLQDALFYARAKAIRDGNINCLAKTMVNIMSHLADVENIAIDGKAATKSSLLDYLRKHYPDKFVEFEINVFQWSRAFYESFSGTTCQAISVYWRVLFENVFQNKLALSKQFLDGPLSVNVQLPFDKVSATNDVNIYKDGNVAIEIGTIHSVKGETHTATLYLESFYCNCETEKILGIFKGTQLTTDEKKKTRKAEAAKMAYVAMSRPTHLLCFACKKDHIAGHENDLKSNGWEIIPGKIGDVS